MQVAATGALSKAERSYPMSEVRGRSREDPMPEGRQPRGVTPRPRSGAAAEVPDCDSTTAKRSYPVSEVRGWLRGDTPHPRSGGAAERRYPASKVRSGNEGSYPESEVRGGDERSYPASEVRGGDREEIPTPQA